MEEASNNERYVVALHHTPKGYFARVVDLPGCIARGTSEVEALENVRAAIRLHALLRRLIAREGPRISVEISA